jgi:hypothetical protein
MEDVPVILLMVIIPEPLVMHGLAKIGTLPLTEPLPEIYSIGCHKQDNDNSCYAHQNTKYAHSSIN